MMSFGPFWLNLGILSTADIPLKASSHLHKFSLMLGTAAFAQIYNPLNMWKKDFCHWNYNQSSHELLLEGTLKHSGFCARLGEPPTLLENHSERSGEGVGRRNRGGSLDEWAIAPSFHVQGRRRRKFKPKQPVRMWNLDPMLPSNPCPCIL